MLRLTLEKYGALRAGRTGGQDSGRGWSHVRPKLREKHMGTGRGTCGRALKVEPTGLGEGQMS